MSQEMQKSRLEKKCLTPSRKGAKAFLFFFASWRLCARILSFHSACCKTTTHPAAVFEFNSMGAIRVAMTWELKLAKKEYFI